MQKEKLCLLLDWNCIKQYEYQVLVLKIEISKVKLNAICLQYSNFETIANEILEVIDECILWAKIEMIITDTISVKDKFLKNKVFVQLHGMSLNEEISTLIFVSC